MNRWKTVFLCLFIFLICLSFEAWAGPLVWGPKKYVRETGKPVSVLDIFTIEKPTGKFYLYVKNGGSIKKSGEKPLRVPVGQVSSIYIKLNGVQIVGPEDLNQQVFNISKDITLEANNTIEVEVRGKPDSYVTVEIRKSPLNPTVENKDNDLWGSNMKDQIVLWWSGEENAEEYVFYRAYSKDGQWIEWFRSFKGEPMNAVDGTPEEAQTMDLCYKIEALDSRGRVIRRYEPICVPKWQKEEVSLPLTQRKKPNTCVSIAKGKDLGNLFLTGRGNPSLPFVQLASLSMPIGIQLASAILPRGSPQSPPPYNSMCLSDEEFTDSTTMNYDDIKKLLKDNKSFLQGDEVKDVDGSFFDPAEIIDFAAQTYGINPQIILATLQKESSALTKEKLLEDSVLKFIMGYGNPSTITDQILDAAKQMRLDFDKLSNGQTTISGWGVGIKKQTGHFDNKNPKNNNPELDKDGKPIYVTPASKVVALLFSYTPWVGKDYGGGFSVKEPRRAKVGGNALFCNMWEQFEFGVKCKPEDILTISGSETITRNNKAQYTTTGCPSKVEWSMSGKGATISSTGLLTASGSACGSLLVTATCVACGTSATRYVRVTDAGKWQLYDYNGIGDWELGMEACFQECTQTQGNELWRDFKVYTTSNNPGCEDVVLPPQSVESIGVTSSCKVFDFYSTCEFWGYPIYCVTTSWFKYTWICH